MKQTTNKPMHAAWVITLDILLGAVILLSFTFFHHVLPRIAPEEVEQTGPVYTKAPDAGSRQTGDYTGGFTTPNIPKPPKPSTGTNTGDPTTPTTPITSGGTIDPPPSVYDISGDFGYKFAPLFAQDHRIYQDATTYQSHDIYMTLHSFDGNLEQQSKKGGSFGKTHVVYYVMDVYVRNIENLFASYKSAYVAADKLYNDTTFGKSVAAINGDIFHGYSQAKPVIVRNGKVIRTADYITDDICVLYFDGTMETITPEEYDWKKIEAKNPYQIWSFGPELMDENGKAKTEISSAVWRYNPRAAIGYVEPGHYVLVCVNGYRDSSEKDSHGIGVNLDALAKIMESYGCKSAYNLDGGASVYAFYGEEMLVQISNSGGSKRSISDLICIGEVVS